MVKAKTARRARKRPRPRARKVEGKAVNDAIKEGGVRMELRRVPKGIRVVLEEHGCYPPTKANGNPACKAKCSGPKCLDPAQSPPPPGPPCCMVRIQGFYIGSKSQLLLS